VKDMRAENARLIQRNEATHSDLTQKLTAAQKNVEIVYPPPHPPFPSSSLTLDGRFTVGVLRVEAPLDAMSDLPFCCTLELDSSP